MTDPKLARPAWRGRTNVDALTIACIEHAEELVESFAPDVAHEFVVTQGSYQNGRGEVNSAGTHDLGGVVDLRWCGHVGCVQALRMAGMAAWHRTPAQGPWVDHIHAVVIGHPRLADSAARQVTAYLTGRDGLKANGPDDGPRLDRIAEPVWPWPPDATPEIRGHLNTAQSEVKAAIEVAGRRPRVQFQLEKARQAISKARKILRG